MPTSISRFARFSRLGVLALAVLAISAGAAAYSTRPQSQSQPQPPPASQDQTPSSQSGSSVPDKPPPPDPKAKKKKESDDPPEAKLRITVTAAETGKPVGSASVYIRYADGKTFFTRKDKQAEENFKTNQDGTLKVPSVPRGKILIQVIAPGWHTYGKYYDIDKDEVEIQIKLDKPPRWY
jgi:type IV secretory pathway VirB10-like protein